MWRRVLSQSPTSVPTDADSQKKTSEYLDGWKALGALLHSGGALSGHERNCLFLNTGSPRFADASAAAGLDHDSDSRGVAYVDWDSDGDLDLWMANRTSPRIRYMQNEIATGNHYLALKLQGVTCNRDAIGARVEVFLEGQADQPLVRSVSAGEGFVSQSSKWLHFGLGPSDQIERVLVHWPGGVQESIEAVTIDNHFVVIQGSGRANVWNRQTSPQLKTSSPKSPAPLESQRILLARRLPMPRVPFVDLQGKATDSDSFLGKPVLINVWATWCQPCLEELSDWNQHHQSLASESLQIVALNADHADAADPFSSENRRGVDELWQRLGASFDVGMVDAAGIEILESAERSLLLWQSPLPIPASFLVDAEGRLAAVYKGSVSVDQLLADVRALKVQHDDVRDASTPLRGKWYTDPFPPDLLAIPEHLTGVGRSNEAYEYLSRHVLPDRSSTNIDPWQQLGVSSRKVVKALRGTAQSLLGQDDVDQAITLYQGAILYDPESWMLRVELSNLLIGRGRDSEAISLNREMTKLRTGHPLPWNNLAWILATSRDDSVRDPEKAIELAEKICNATENQEPSALDTLAVSYAAAGRYDDAVKTAQLAIARCQATNLSKLADVISDRAKLYKQKQPYPP